MRHGISATVLICLALATSGCGDEDSGDGDGAGASSSGPGASSSGAGGSGAGGGDEAQSPPTTGGDDVEAWLAEGHYKQWACEPEKHAARSPSPHGVNRICSNDLLSGHGAGEYPVGAAAVKELYADEGDDIVGIAVYRHVTAGTTGDTWYWYERVPLDSPAPHDADGVVADGLGGTAGSPEETICVGCHMAAGSDAMHSGHDFVYTQVQ
jgi:hypothetical protein